MINPKTFHYLLVTLVAFVFTVTVTPVFIRVLRQKYLGQYIREDGPQHHQAKAGTPTAGGVVILAGTIVGLGAALGVFGLEFFTPELWLATGVTLVLGALGFTDDYLKIAKKKNKGVSGYTKLAIQALCGLAVGGYMVVVMDTTHVVVFNWVRVDLGPLYPLFSALVVMGASNAVNLTDGLDGLAASTSLISLITLMVLFNGTLFSTLAPTYPDLSLLCLALSGATLAFLLYNFRPARLFMGDTGSLALGGAMGAMAVLSGLEFWLVLIGAVFVLEALSVILQVISFKTTGKRIFKMSPLHHHFELLGWSETQVVAMFVILQFLMCRGALFLYNM